MPQAAVAAVGSFLVAAGASAAVATFVANVFVYAAATYLLNRASQLLAPKPRSAGLGTGTEINYYDSGASVRIAYGRVRTGGMETIPPITSGSDNAFLHKVLTLAGHEIDSYNYTHFDIDTITNAQIGPMSFSTADGKVNSGPFSDHAWIRHYRGTATDSADRILIGVDSTAFGNARARGIAKAAIQFKFNQEIYQSIPTITFTYQGKRCYDPRLDTSPGANPTNASYIAWTANPALCLADYLMASYGGEYEASEIDWASVSTAATYCDVSVSVPSGVQPRYTCNGVIFAAEEFTENVKALTDAMLGRVIFSDGRWRMYAGSWQTPTFAIQKTDWVSGLSIRFEQGREKRFNHMKCWYVDREREYQRVECNPRFNTTYRAADGGENIEAEIEQLLCDNEFEAQRKAEFLLRQSRNQIMVIGRLPPRFQNIALWDTGVIVFDHLGWSSKTFRAVGIDMNTDGSMDCVFAEEQSSDWTDLSSGDYNSPSTAALPAVNGPFLPTVYTSQMEEDAATELFITGAGRISGGFAPYSAVGSYADLNLIRDAGGELLTSAGGTTLVTNNLTTDGSFIVTGVFRASAGTNSVTTVYPYLQNVSSGGINVGTSNARVTLTQSITPYTIQDQFSVSSGVSYRAGLRKSCSANSVFETWEEPMRIQVEFIKR